MSNVLKQDLTAKDAQIMINKVVNWDNPNALFRKKTIDGCEVLIPAQLFDEDVEMEVSTYLDAFFANQDVTDLFETEADPNLEN